MSIISNLLCFEFLLARKVLIPAVFPDEYVRCPCKGLRTLKPKILSLHNNFFYCWIVLNFTLVFHQTQDVAPEEGLTAGLQETVHAATQGVANLCFEEEEDEDAFYMKDLPPHACRYRQVLV